MSKEYQGRIRLVVGVVLGDAFGFVVDVEVVCGDLVEGVFDELDAGVLLHETEKLLCLVEVPPGS